MRKPAFCICENSCAEMTSAFGFVPCTVKSIYFLNPKIQVLNHLLCQSSLVCVGPGRKPRRQVFSRRAQIEVIIYSANNVTLIRHAFLICFPMDYRDFSVKSKVIIHCFKQWDYDFRFSLFVNSFLSPIK